MNGAVPQKTTKKDPLPTGALTADLPEFRTGEFAPTRPQPADARANLPDCLLSGLSRTPDQGSLVYMSTVTEIKAAISQLTLEERAEVARCLHEWEDDAWDKQIQQDLAAGKLDGLLAKVDDDIDQGKLRDLP